MAYFPRIRRRCASPKTIIWSRHSRRIVPISLSTYPFCHGEPAAMGLSRMPMARNRRGSAVDPIPIADQVAWDLIPGECFRQLLRDPFCRRVRGYIEPDKLSPSQLDNDQNVELDKADGRHHEQIHGRDMRRMIAQERAPALTRRIAPLGLVLADARLRHHKAELE